MTDLPFEDRPEDRAERGSALDEFAKRDTPAPAGDSGGAMIPQQAYSTSGQEVIGAQRLAKYRVMDEVLANLRSLAAAAGEDWFYRFPVKSKGGATSYVEGPSVKLAYDLARVYGNCFVGALPISEGPTGWTFMGKFIDYETGFSISRPFQQRKSQRGMNTEAGRGDDIAYQIGVSKAERNVIVNALQTFATFAFEEAKASTIEKIGKRLEEFRTRIIEKLTAEKVDIARVDRVIGRAAKDWIATDVARVMALGRAVNDGMATWDETFPPLDQPVEEPATEIDVATGQAEAFAQDVGKGKKPEGGEAATDTSKADAAAPAEAKGQPGDAAAEPSPGENGPATKDAKPAPASVGGQPTLLSDADDEAADAKQPAETAARKATRLKAATTLLKKLAEALSGLRSEADVAATVEKLLPLGADDTPAGVAAATIIQAHEQRITGKSSPVEADAAAKAAIQALK